MERLGASNSVCLLARQYYSMMGNPDCQDGLELGKFGKEPKNSTWYRGIINMETKRREGKRMHLDSRVDNEPEVNVELFNLLY